MNFLTVAERFLGILAAAVVAAALALAEAGADGVKVGIGFVIGAILSAATSCASMRAPLPPVVSALRASFSPQQPSPRAQARQAWAYCRR